MAKALRFFGAVLGSDCDVIYFHQDMNKTVKRTGSLMTISKDVEAPGGDLESDAKQQSRADVLLGKQATETSLKKALNLFDRDTSRLVEIPIDDIRAARLPSEEAVWLADKAGFIDDLEAKERADNARRALEALEAEVEAAKMASASALKLVSDAAMDHLSLRAMSGPEPTTVRGQNMQAAAHVPIALSDYHFPMLNDVKRNDAFYFALQVGRCYTDMSLAHLLTLRWPTDGHLLTI